jgi:uroporphyrinogen-III synthase
MTHRPPRVIVTRPRDQAGPWVERLRERGLDAVALPLLDIADAPDRQALAEAWSGLPGRAAVMFVSANAAQAFFAAAPAGMGWPAGVCAAATGPGTAAALRAAGVPSADIAQPPADAPQFDSEHLWPVLAARDWRGSSVLIVRGEGGRDWLGERWAAAGARVDRLAAYRRGAPHWLPDERTTLEVALADPAGHRWLLSSSQGIVHLAQALTASAASVDREADAAPWPVGAVPALAAHSAVATHPRIAESARAAGFGHVHACAPDIDAVVACLESAADAPAPRR